MNDNLELELGGGYNRISKIEGMPKIIYRNSEPKNKEFMEEQFNIWSISDYERYDKKYSEENYDEWKHLILDEDLILSPKELSQALNVIEPIINWYDSNKSETCIFMEDVVDFSLVNNWGFDWKFLEYHLPYNWDCIQLFPSSKKCIRMHLHPWMWHSTSHYCFMITRYFAKRLKEYHYINGKFKLHYPTPDKSISSLDYGSLDLFFYDLGLTYTLPIFSLNSYLISNNITSNDVHDKTSSDAIRYWWRNKASKFSNFEFFHYNKGDDEWKMEVLFDSESKKPEVYMDKAETIMIWI